MNKAKQGSLLDNIILSDSDDETLSTQDDESALKKRGLNDSETTNNNATKDNSNKEQTLQINLPSEELKTTKRPRHRKPFDEDLLVGSAGLSRIYQEFPNACQFQGRGSEATYLQRLITMYKEWAFQLHPGLSFQDIVNKLESLGSKSKVRGYLEGLRNIERERYTNEVLIPRAEKEMQNMKSNVKAVKKSPKRKQKQPSNEPTTNNTPSPTIGHDEDDIGYTSPPEQTSTGLPQTNQQQNEDDDDEDFDVEEMFNQVYNQSSMRHTVIDTSNHDDFESYVETNTSSSMFIGDTQATEIDPEITPMNNLNDYDDGGGDDDATQKQDDEVISFNEENGQDQEIDMNDNDI